MPILITSYVISILFGYHVVKTGRPQYWLFILLAFPGVGATIYFLAEVLPDLGRSRKTTAIKHTIERKIDPDKAYRQVKVALAEHPTVNNKIALARIYEERDDLIQAITLYKECLQGIHAQDPDIITALTTCYFEQEAYQDVIDTISKLPDDSPVDRKPTLHLLYAKSLGKVGAVRSALQEYEALSETYQGEEPNVLWGILLQDQGHTQKATRVLQAVIDDVADSNKTYKETEQYWADVAKQYI